MIEKNPNKQVKKTKSTKTTQRKATPAFFSPIEKSKEISRQQSAETAGIENHYVNGAMKQTNVNVNRGK